MITTQHGSELRSVEFKKFYEEIEWHSGRVEAILTLSIQYTGAFLGIILSLRFVKNGVPQGAKNIAPGLFLIPLPFILPVMLLVRQHLNSVVRIASYILVFYEEALPNEGIGWQMHLQMLRERVGGPEASGMRVFNTAIAGVWRALAAFCIVPFILSILYFYYISDPVDGAVVGMYIILIIIVVVAGMRWGMDVVGPWAESVHRYLPFLRVLMRRLEPGTGAWSTKNFEDYVSDWRTLKEKLREVAGPSE